MGDGIVPASTSSDQDNGLHVDHMKPHSHRLTTLIIPMKPIVLPSTNNPLSDPISTYSVASSLNMTSTAQVKICFII